MSIKIRSKVKLHHPILLAAWPGMGNVALGAIHYLRKKLAMAEFAKIDVTQFYHPEGIVVVDGLGKLPSSPKSIFYNLIEPPIIVFENEIQIGGEEGMKLIKLVLDFAREIGTVQIITAAAFPTTSSYKDPSQIFGVAGSISGMEQLRRLNIQIMERGTISGLNGLFLGYAQEQGIESLCLLATIPIYATNFINPRAWQAIIKVLENILAVRVDLAELDRIIAEIDEKMEQIEEQLQTMIENREASEEESEVNPQVLKRIEQLFEEAKHNRAKAMELKRELDRYQLFEKYEDRFLDLFKKG